MLLQLVALYYFRLALAGGYEVTRDHFGDVFRMRDCHNGSSRCDRGGVRPALPVPGRPCHCQCSPTHLAYREDKQQCVKELRECYMSVFYRPFAVEAIPLVYLPTSGQLVHPDAHLSLSGRKNVESGFPMCKAAVSQYLTPEGWRTLIRQESTGGPVFGLFADGNKTFLQFLGSPQDRRTLQQHLVLVRLFCKITGYAPFETCVAIRIGWVPGVEALEDTELPATGKANMMVVGLSLGILCMVYVFAVLVYLKIRRQMLAKQKAANADPEAKLPQDDDQKISSLGRADLSKRIEMYHVSSLGRRKSVSSTGGRDPWTHTNPIVETYNRTWTDRMGQHGCEFRAQDFKLQPEFLDPEFMASPPQQVLEYLERLQNSVTFARHRLRSCYRYQPTLNGIPEDDYFYQELKTKEAAEANEHRTTPDGGSASSSNNSFSEEDGLRKNFASIPPKKPRRKSCEGKHLKSQSDQEQKDIQRAMNTLNDTLNALELDICHQDSVTEDESVKTSRSKSCCDGSNDDLDSSSCSSLSAVTVLARGNKLEVKRSSCSHSFEKDLSEDVGTFSNSTYAVGRQGLFHDGNKLSNSSSEDIKGEALKSRRVNAEKLVRTHLEDWCNVQGKHRRSAKCHDKRVSTEQDSLEIPRLRKASSSESLNTIGTEMTTDSLDSRASSPDHPSPTPSLMEMWISRLIQHGSVPYTRTRRKSKKKLVLPESDVESWEHVCKRHKDDAITTHEQTLIDKLSHCDSKTNCDVAGYFQSLKQDVLKDHLRGWLASGKSHRNHKGDSVKSRRKSRCSDNKRLVSDGQNGEHESWTNSCDMTLDSLDVKERSDSNHVDTDSSSNDPMYETISNKTEVASTAK